VLQTPAGRPYLPCVPIIQSVRWSDDGESVLIIDQRLLPERFVERELRSLDDVCDAIKTLAVRGAPAIGIAGAMGLAVIARGHASASREEFLIAIASAAAAIRATRPTAVNLAWAVDRVVNRALPFHAPAEMAGAMRDEATDILEEDRAMCRRIGEHGATLVTDRARVLTHCNAGALATGGIGTALATIYVAAELGKSPTVYADETRPLFQGSRLTAWELTAAGIPVTILADGAAGSLMSEGEVDMVIVGADRIAVNGDTANKIGTYALAILARHHGIPFYVAAPTSTFDPKTRTGNQILVEQRHPDELRRGAGGGGLTAPANVAVHNPAFDVTPAELITAIISDRGIHRPSTRARLARRRSSSRTTAGSSAAGTARFRNIFRSPGGSSTTPSRSSTRHSRRHARRSRRAVSFRTRSG
jgi:methylthioribose-1-phosphate isomerase